MRILQSFWYALGAKPTFDQLPKLIEDFFQAQGLTYAHFHYYFEDLNLTATQSQAGCLWAAQRYPFLGRVHCQETGNFIVHALHNFSDETTDSIEAIYTILPKLYQRHGFTEVSLLYRDITFFSRKTPSPAPIFTFPMQAYAGSGITILRSGIPAGNAAILTIAVEDPADIPAASAYAEALKQHLNCGDYVSSTQLILDAQEEALYEGLHRKAQPLIQIAKEFFDSRMPKQSEAGNPSVPKQFSTQLKKIAGQYGYTYQGFQYPAYQLEKRLPCGHRICLEFVSNPHHPSVDPFIDLQGLGFQHQIWAGRFRPQSAQEATRYLEEYFAVLAEAEEAFLSAIADLYLPTPDWFIPT